MNIAEFKEQVTNRDEALDCLEFLQLAFTKLPEKRIKQDMGEAYLNKETNIFLGRSGRKIDNNPGGQECGMCVGFWISYFLDIEDDYSCSRFYKDREYDSYVRYYEGKSVFEHCMQYCQYDHDQASVLLRQLAGLNSYDDPFYTMPWQKHPKDVFQELITIIKEKKNAA